MTDKERTEMRILQNKVVDRLTRRFPDFPHNQPIFIDRDPNPTIESLKTIIYPQYKGLLEDLLK
jgi:hypothetical protein